MFKNVWFKCSHGLELVGVRWASSEVARRTALYDLHRQYKGKMVEFAGFILPVQYEGAPIAESHLHTRSQASLFDVSHMLQTLITGKHRCEFLESLCVTDIKGMKENTSALSLFTNENGGILDDLIVTKFPEELVTVSNASRRLADMQLLKQNEGKFRKAGYEVQVDFLEDRSLLAVQGPLASKVVASLAEGPVATLRFMGSLTCQVGPAAEAWVTRCGYTGEDGFEISIPSSSAFALASALLSSCPQIKLAGLGARDTLRLEAGLCLYGNDIDETTTPAQAGLMWTIGKSRREAANFPGAETILKEAAEGPKRKRVGLISVVGGPPARQGCELHEMGKVQGLITSGAPSPSLGENIAMAYLPPRLAKPEKRVVTKVRATSVHMAVTKMPFVPTNYYSPKKKLSEK